MGLGANLVTIFTKTILHAEAVKKKFAGTAWGFSPADCIIKVMRICSLLPSSTEIIFALGLEENLVGVTHECDYPPQARDKPVVVKSILEGKGKLSSARIDELVNRNRSEGKSVYLIDSERLSEIKPDLIITQGLCNVCAVSENEVTEVCEVLENSPEILSLNPTTIGEILDSHSASGRSHSDKREGFATRR